MAEAASLPTIQEEELGDDFYEQIQAPKFVDFTAPEIRRSHDDRYWFCFRVGCDQNHAEELDSEAIYKKFVLRVMAARSPNVRLRKALNKREASANLKCPLTAPAKSSKSRVPRLALISSMSKNMIDNDKKPLSKVSATPSAKVKQSSAKSKALTTPSRNQKKSSNLEQFRTVQSKKAMNVDVPKNRVIAKALVFHSPKKAVKIKSSIELKKTPMKSLCSAMKKLELDSVKKKNEDASMRKKLRGREVKSRVFDSLYSNSRGNEEKKKKGASRIHEGGHDNDSSDMEIEADSIERFTESSSTEETEKKQSREECEEDGEKSKIPEVINRNDNDDNKENEGEFTENDEKENASVPDENRVLVKKAKHEDTRKTQKKPTSNATGSQAAKYRKLKPTNPKPFKLRTDERGILKEANLEKKPLSPLKETTAKGGKALRKHHNVNQKNEQDADNNATQEDQSGSIRCSVLDKSNVKVKNKLSATPHKSAAPKLKKRIDVSERPLKHRDKSGKKLDDKFKRKSQMMQPTLVRPKGALSRKKENGVLDEKCSNSNILQTKESEEAKACNNGASPSCSSSRPKKATTVPKEPNFHSLHVPKSCIKKIT